MTTPTPLPLRVLVKGASTVNWISPMSGPRTDFTFPRVIEERLLESGRACEVRMSTMTSEKTATILGTWQREVLNFSPDVIVLVYGHYETIHLMLPRWLERHANSLAAHPRRLAKLYRQHVLRPIWMSLARLQARLDRKLPASVRRRRIENVGADLAEYIGHVQQVGSPLVYCFELLPPASRYVSWFPGMAARMELMNAEIARMVASFDRSNIRYFRVRPIMESVAGSLDEATPDGFHYSPELHRAIGEALATDIDAWAHTQAHLSVPSEVSS